MPYPMKRGRGRRGLGFLAPTNVPARLRPWVDQTSPNYPASNAALSTSDYLRARAAQAEQLFKSYGGRTAANPDAPALDPMNLPWNYPPVGYEPFIWNGTIATPTANNTDITCTTLFNQAVPQGWDGVIQAIANFYTGPGFVAGAGLLTWRITRNGQPFKTFDSIQVAYGTYTQQGGVQGYPLPAPIRIFAGDVIKFVVNHAAPGLSTQGTQIITFLGGYLYPKQAQ